MTENELRVWITVNLTKLDAGIAKAMQTIHNFTATTKKDSANLVATTNAMQINWVAGYALMAAAVHKLSSAVNGSFSDMIKVFAGFEQSLANTQSVAQASTEDLLKMEEAARRVGATTRSTASEAANALYYLASAGFTASESIAALDGVNALAIATGSDLARTSETIATVIRQYNLETQEATRIANTFTAAITNSLATMDKLTKSFEYVGPIAAGLGLSVEETTGALELLYNKGFSGEKAGRGLRTILVNLADSTSVVNKRLGRLGITFDEINPTVNSLADIFDTLREHQVDATNAAAIFGKVSGVQLASLVAQASDASGGINELTAAVTGTNRAFEAMDIQMDTLQGSFDKFKNAEEALKIKTGKELTPALRLVTDTATSFILNLQKLPSVVLAVGSVLGVGATAALSFATALVLVRNVLALMQITAGALIPSFGALFTAAGLVIGLGAGVVAVATKLNAVKAERSAEHFSSLAQEMKVSREGLKDFYDMANRVASKAGKLSAYSVADATRLKEQITAIAQAEGLTVEQALRMAEANKDFVANAGISIGILKQKLKVEQENLDTQDESFSKEQRIWRERELAIERGKKLLADKEKKEQEMVANTAEAYESLQLAFEKADEYQKALGDDYDRNAELAKAYLNSLSILIEQGLKYESEEVKTLQKNYADLQAQKGKVVGKDSDAELQKEVFSDTVEKLAEIAETEKLNIKYGIDYNAQKERSAVIIAGLNKLLAGGFTFEGGGIQKYLDLYDEYISVSTTLADDYIKKIKEIGKSERELAVEKANGDEEAIKAIHEYYNELESVALLNIALTERDERQKNANNIMERHIDLLEEVGLNNIELIKLERERTLKSVAGYKDSEEAVEAYYDAILNEAKLKQLQENVKKVLTFTADIADGINDIVQDTYQRQLDKLDEALAESLEMLEIQEEAALEAAGLAEETEAEVAQRELADLRAQLALETDLARRAGLQELIDAKALEVQKYAIEEEYAKKREDAEEKHAKKAAAIQYKMAMASWYNNLLQTASTGALAIMETWKNFGGWPWGAVAAGVMTGLVGAQYGNVMANKPEPPKFENGGIIPGSSYKGDATPVLANAGELILNRAQQNDIANQLDYTQPTSLYATLYIDLGNEVIEKQVQGGINDGRIKSQKGVAIR